jgi:hypothetical protein
MEREYPVLLDFRGVSDFFFAFALRKQRARDGAAHMHGFGSRDKLRVAMVRVRHLEVEVVAAVHIPTRRWI